MEKKEKFRKMGSKLEKALPFLCAFVLVVGAVMFFSSRLSFLMIVVYVLFYLSLLGGFIVALYFVGELFTYHKHKEEILEEKRIQQEQEAAKREEALIKAYHDRHFKTLTADDKKVVDEALALTYKLLKDYQVNYLFFDEKESPPYIVYDAMKEGGNFKVRGYNYQKQLFCLEVCVDEELKTLYLVQIPSELKQKTEAQKAYASRVVEEPKMPNPNIAKARAKRKAGTQPKKENVVIQRDGKKRVAPNWNLVAKDWISANIGYLNKKVLEELNKQSGEIVKANIPASRLPEEQAWSLIGDALKENEEIDGFNVKKNGLELIIKR